jgi:Zn-dependent peptidase ImmA (M78 family)
MMLMSKTPVTPEVLRWARQTAGLSIDDVVEKINRKRVTAQTIEARENGEDSPTYPQLERLAYEIYKRPLAIFFFPQPPEEVSPQQSFRTLPEYEIEAMPPRVRFLLRKARALQVNLQELYDGLIPTERQIVRDLDFNPDAQAEQMAAEVRNYLEVPLEQQVECTDAEQAFKLWRARFEDCGVFVFKDAFRDESFSGFCLYDDRFPLIYVNNSKPFTRQSFTLFHELAHLLFKTGGIDTRLEDYVDYLEGVNRRIEILCNKFAAEFLVPSADFDNRAGGIEVDDQAIQLLADRYHVSREVVLRKFYNRGQVDQQYYQERVAAWAASASPRAPGGSYYANMGVYLSDSYLERAFTRFHQNQIGIEQLADYLGVKVKSIPGMEAVLFRRGNAA